MPPPAAEPSSSDPARRPADPGALEDARLIRAIQGGDTSAWGPLLARHQSMLFNLCYRIVGRRDWAGDLAQDAIVRIIHSIGGFDARARFSTWIYTIATNVCLSALRSEKYRRHASLDAADGPGATPPHAERPGSRGRGGTAEQSPYARDREPDPGSRVIQGERVSAARAALARLDPEQRAILVLRDVQGLDYGAIGQALGVPVGTVKSRLFRARAALRDEIERADPEGGLASGEE